MDGAIEQAKERERLRIEDRLRLVEDAKATAIEIVRLRKHRPGYSWASGSDVKAMELIAAAEALDDDELRHLADELCGTVSPHEGRAPVAELDAGYRAIVKRLGELRRATFSDG